METSGEMRGGKEEEAKLELSFLEKCQKNEKKENRKDHYIFYEEMSFWYLEEQILYYSGLKYNQCEILQSEDIKSS